jgi:hypothetical protein
MFEIYFQVLTKFGYAFIEKVLRHLLLDRFAFELSEMLFTQICWF